MVGDIKKIKLSKLEEIRFREVLNSWSKFIAWIGDQDEKECIKCMAFEIENRKRAQYIDRIRTRYNKIRNYNELKALEKHLKMIINVNYLP